MEVQTFAERSIREWIAATEEAGTATAALLADVAALSRATFTPALVER